jgi:glycerol-3-phosphate acyltransferase PlsY
VVAVGYLMGSVPFGLYAARYSLRSRLTGSASSSNLAPSDLYQRSGPNQKIAVVTFVLELFKGFVPTFTGYLAVGTPGAVSTRSAALVGHNVPLFARWHGSKSLAPLLGVLLAIYPLVVVILGMVWTSPLAVWRYASLAALATAVVSPLALAALDAGGANENMVLLAAVLWSLLVFFAHRENIRRLVSGRGVKINTPVGANHRRRVR